MLRYVICGSHYCIRGRLETICETFDVELNFNFGHWAKLHYLALFSGWSSLCLDNWLVPQLGVPEIGHRQVVGLALVQRRLRMELPQGVFVVIDTHWVLCYFLTTRSFCV